MSVFLVEFSAVQAACALRWASVDSAGEGGLSFLQAIIRAALVVSLAYFPPFTPCLFVGIHTPLTEGSLCERIAQSSCFQFNRFGLFSFSFFSKEDWSDRTAKLMRNLVEPNGGPFLWTSAASTTARSTGTTHKCHAVLESPCCPVTQHMPPAEACSALVLVRRSRCLPRYYRQGRGSTNTHSR
jgi:hypothetical protein